MKFNQTDKILEKKMQIFKIYLGIGQILKITNIDLISFFINRCIIFLPKKHISWNYFKKINFPWSPFLNAINWLSRNYILKFYIGNFWKRENDLCKLELLTLFANFVTREKTLLYTVHYGNFQWWLIVYLVFRIHYLWI